MIKRIINWFSNSPVRQDRSSEHVDVVVRELRKIQDVNPDASAEVMRLSDVLAGRQSSELLHDEIEGPETAAWRKRNAEVAENQEAWNQHCNGSGR